MKPNTQGLVPSPPPRKYVLLDLEVNIASNDETKHMIWPQSPFHTVETDGNRRSRLSCRGVDFAESISVLARLGGVDFRDVMALKF